MGNHDPFCRVNGCKERGSPYTWGLCEKHYDEFNRQMVKAALLGTLLGLATVIAALVVRFS